MNNPLESLFPASDTTSSRPKHAGGRPRLWTESRCLQVVDSLKTWVDADATNVTLELGLHGLGHMPWWISNMQTSHPEYEQFTQSVQSLKKYCQAKIANMALFGAVNPRFAQFYMSAQAGWAMNVNSNMQHAGAVELKHVGLTVNFIEHQKDSTSATQQI